MSLFAQVKRRLLHNICFSPAALFGNLQTSPWRGNRSHLYKVPALIDHVAHSTSALILILVQGKSLNREHEAQEKTRCEKVHGS